MIAVLPDADETPHVVALARDDAATPGTSSAVEDWKREGGQFPDFAVLGGRSAPIAAAPDPSAPPRSRARRR